MPSTVDKRTIGLYHKFTVYRTDGQDGPGMKHHNCEHFVLDLTHDPHAGSALRAYAISCRNAFPQLSKDLLRKADEIDRMHRRQT